jgi:hypothetical protein
MEWKIVLPSKDCYENIRILNAGKGLSSMAGGSGHSLFVTLPISI